MRIPISTKLIGLVVSFLVTATALFAYKSSELFESVLVQREKDANLSMASARLKEVDAILLSVKQRTELLGKMMMASVRGEVGHSKDEISFNMNTDKSL